MPLQPPPRTTPEHRARFQAALPIPTGVPADVLWQAGARAEYREVQAEHHQSVPGVLSVLAGSVVLAVNVSPQANDGS